MGKKPVLARGDLSKMLLPEPLHRLIFVYNDLMDESIMNELCPEPKLVTTAMYSGFRFIINSDGVATLILEPKSVAYGVVWQIDEIALIGLDISVGRPTFFERNGGFKRNSCGAIVADHYMAKNSKPGTALQRTLARS